MVAHEARITSSRRQRGACRVYDLRALKECVLALEDSQPGPRTVRLAQQLRGLENTRDQASWSTDWRTNFVNLEHALEVAEKRGAA